MEEGGGWRMEWRSQRRRGGIGEGYRCGSPPQGELEARTGLRKLDGGEMGGMRWIELRRLATRNGRKEMRKMAKVFFFLLKDLNYLRR